MAHSLTPAPTTATTVLSERAQKSSFYFSSKNGGFPTSRVCCIGHPHQHQHQHQSSSTSDRDQLVPSPLEDHPLRRRALTVGLSGALVMVGLSLSGEESARAARRPPPPPPEEKKDPNVSGVQAKVLASKKRKEALKEQVAKLREKGKPIIEPPPIPE